MNDPTEDRLRAALTDRAGAARTSPDALDGVFGRVARHRRAVRVAAGAGTAFALVAGGLVASAAMRTDERVAPGDVASAPPSQAPSPTPSVAPTAPAYAADRAIVAMRDGRLVEISTTTGEEIRTLAEWEADAMDWSPDRKLLAVVQNCLLVLFDAKTGDLRSDLGNARHPAFSPDSTKLASVPCKENEKNADVTLLDIPKRTHTTFVAPSPTPYTGQPSYMQDLEGLSASSGLEWTDDRHLLVLRNYEGAYEAMLLDVTSDREIADGERTSIRADALAAHDGVLYWTDSPFYPDPEAGPTKVFRRAPGQADAMLFERADVVRQLTLDDRGTLLFVDKTGLWRWDESSGTAVLITRDAVAVAA